MMRRAVALCALVLASTAAPLAAQEATPTPTAKMAGNWDFSFTSPQGAATWRVTFEQAGDTLKGQAQSDFGPLPMSNGWISGNDLSFSLSLNFNGQNFNLDFSGVVKGDEAEGTIAVPGAGIEPFAFAAKRVVEPGRR